MLTSGFLQILFLNPDFQGVQMPDFPPLRTPMPDPYMLM